MKLGSVLFEAKLTEGDFQMQRAEVVEQYGDLREVFETRQLPRVKSKYVSYQLIRNVLSAPPSVSISARYSMLAGLT